jgi:hypothetical protein
MCKTGSKLGQMAQTLARAGMSPQIRAIAVADEDLKEAIH